MQGVLIYWFNIVAALIEIYLPNATGSNEPDKMLAILQSIKIPQKMLNCILMMESIHGVGYWAIKGENSAGNSCFSYFFSQGYGFDKYYQCLLLKAKVNFSRSDGFNFHVSVYFSLRVSGFRLPKSVPIANSVSWEGTLTFQGAKVQ